MPFFLPILFIPIGHNQSLRRFPWLTASIMALCLFVQVHGTLYGPSPNQIMDAVAAQEEIETQVLVEYGS